MARSAREISAILRAAGHCEEARVLLEGIVPFEGERIDDYRGHLKIIADELSATAVADKVKIANDVGQNYGRD